MKLTSENVRNIFADCLFRDEEVPADRMPEGAVVVKAVISTMGFHPQRLESHKEEIKQLLSQLPEGFFEGKGGGWTFLNACMTREDIQWGEHANMEQLFALGLAIKCVRECMPGMRHLMPGGMPYYAINLEGFKE